jgi:hypothetical protein
MSGEEKTVRDIAHADAVTALEEHGHLFQQRCVNEIRQNHERLPFVTESEEYPVTFGQESVVIDFILSHKKKPKHYLIFECKRANPDYIAWLFSRPDLGVEPLRPRFLATKLDYRRGSLPPAYLLTTPRLKMVGGNLDYVTFGLEVSQQKGKGKKLGKTEAIHQACQQVLSGIVGLIWEQLNHRHTVIAASELALTPHFPQYFVPVVATTANLYRTTFRPSKVDLCRGTLHPDANSKTEQVPWVYYDFPLRDAWRIAQPDNSLVTPPPNDETKQLFKTKSIAIVNAQHLGAFLNAIDLDED